MDPSQLVPADRPSLAVARWQVNSGTDDLILEIFQETPIESGLIEAIILSVVLLRSGYSFGDTDALPQHNPLYPAYSPALARHGR